MRRVGIFAGTFDPVHAGHISFALQAAQQADLHQVVFLPERQPRFKQGSEHFGHRVAMLNRALRPHRRFSVLELTDRHFSVKRTIPQLRRQFRETQLVFLVGSDVLEHLAGWPDVERLLESSELVIGTREGVSLEAVEARLQRLPRSPRASFVVKSQVAAASSGQVRAALQHRISAVGCLPSVQRYASQNWLYVSVKSV